MGCGASKPELSPQEAGATAPPPAVAVPVIDDSTSASKVAGTTSKEPVASVPSAPPMSPSFAAASAAPLAVVHAPPPDSPLQTPPPAPLASSAAELGGGSRYQELRQRRTGIINQVQRLAGELLLFGQAMPVIGHVCEGLREILTSFEKHQEQADYVFEAWEKMISYLTSLKLMAENVKTYESGNQEIVEKGIKKLNDLVLDYLEALDAFEENGQLKRAWTKRAHVDALTKLDKEITECLEHLDRDYVLVRDADLGRRVRDQGDGIRQIKQQNEDTQKQVDLGNAKHDTTHAKLDELKQILLFRHDSAEAGTALKAMTRLFFNTGIELVRCDAPKAIEVFLEAVDEDPQMSCAWLLLSEAYEKEHGPCQDALDAAYKCIGAMPSFFSTELQSWCYLTLGTLLIDLHVEKSCLKVQQNLTPWKEIITSVAGEAEEMFRKAIELNRRDGWPHLCLADLLLKSDKFDDAAEEYRAALSCASNPKDSIIRIHAHGGLCRVYQEKGELSTVDYHSRERSLTIKRAKRALRGNPDIQVDVWWESLHTPSDDGDLNRRLFKGMEAAETIVSYYAVQIYGTAFYRHHFVASLGPIDADDAEEGTAIALNEAIHDSSRLILRLRAPETDKPNSA